MTHDFGITPQLAGKSILLDIHVNKRQSLHGWDSMDCSSDVSISKTNRSDCRRRRLRWFGNHLSIWVSFSLHSQLIDRRNITNVTCTDNSDLFTGVLYNNYGPPRGFCFDILCDDEPIIDDKFSPDYNVDRRVSWQFFFMTRISPSFPI